MDMPSPGKKIAGKNNWFAQNPKKTLFSLVFLIIVAAVGITEKVLESKATTRHANIQRSIRLREYQPLLYRYMEYHDPSMTVFDSFISKRYVLRVDRDGFVIPSKIHQTPDLTMVFLGASTTECTWVDEENRFPYLVGRLLEKETGRKINSYNASKPGNNTLHSLDVLLNKIIPLKPQLVVMMHNINDVNILLYEKTYWNNNPYRSPISTHKPSVSSNLKEIRDLIIPYTYAGIKELIGALRGHREEDEFRHIRDQKISIDRPGLVAQFRQNLEIFVAICKIKGIIPVLMTQMNRFTDHPDPIVLRAIQKSQSLNYEEYKDIFDQFNQTVRDVGKEQGVTVVDLGAKVPPTKEYLFDPVHLTDEGSKFAAAIIAAGLRPWLEALPPGNKPSK